MTLTNFAAVYAQQGEIGEVYHHATQARALAAHIKSSASVQSIQDLRQPLELWKDVPAVKKLDEQLRLVWRKLQG